MTTLWQKLYSQLTAIETIGVGQQGPHLSKRGQRALNWLRKRRANT